MLLAMVSCFLQGALPSTASASVATARGVTRSAGEPHSLALRRSTLATTTTGATLLSEGFSANSTFNNWVTFGDACLTAGTASTTPATSIVPCLTTAPQDAVGQGALQLTAPGVSQYGMAIAKTPLPTANGLQITFDDYAFNGTTPGSEGIGFFLTDASKPLPTVAGVRGGGLGYSGTTTAPGLANAYVGVALDEYGGFSSSSGGFNGGPGQIPETIAVRGSATSNYQYIGGATNSAGKPASLPFSFDQPTLKTRPTNAPTIRATLTPAGLLTVAIDRHDGNGFGVYYSQSIVGVGGQPAVPANVYFGLTSSSGTHYNTHQVTGLVVSTIAPPTTTVTTFVNEPFSGIATGANVWQKYGSACLTAGTTATPTTSLPACGSAATQDAAGSGALQLTKATGSASGVVIDKTPFSTANGLQITFTDYAFNGTNPGSEGIAFFLTDASQPIPAHGGLAGGGMGYIGTTATNGLPNAYVGVGLDEYGSFSSTAGGYNGGPGIVPETVAIRGAASTNYVYLGGATNTAGKAASLPFALDAPTATTRPTGAPTIQATLTAAGLLTVAINRHDGNGFVTYFSQKIVGVNGQPAVPANVYFGLSASTGSHYETHQVAGLTVTSANAPAPAPISLTNPPQIVSTNGSLTFNVTTQLNAKTGFPEYIYNGSTVPPTLRLLPGDTLVVNLTNNLPVPATGAGYTNNTNLHYHGLHVSPQAPGDDSIDMLAAPGQSLHYAIAIPVNHPPGLYWYHAHAHGEAERQTLSGMSGALIVDGIAAYTPQVSTMTEQVLVMRDAPLAGTSLPDADMHQIYAMKWAMQHGVKMHASARGATAQSAFRLAASTSADRSEVHGSSTAQTRNPYVIVDGKYKRFVRSTSADSHCVAGNPEQPVHALTVNGQTQPAIQIAPGEQQFWRMVNAGADTYLDVQVDNTKMQIVAIDGVPLSSGVNTPASMTVSDWVLPPASRVEFILTGPPSGTTAYLRTNCFDAGQSGNAMPAEILASINPTPASTAKHVANLAPGRAVARISPRAVAFHFHTAPTIRPASASLARTVTSATLRARSAATIKATTVSATRTIYYTDQNNINGITYDPAAPPQFYAQSGTVEQWTISNSSSQVHTFHIHQIHFVVQAINGVQQAAQYVMDNVNVPAATASGPGTVTLLLDFTDPTIIGTFLLHCHILSHEDGGMMAKIRIGTSPALSLGASSVLFKSATAGAQSVAITGGTAPYSVTGCTGVASASIVGANVSVVPSNTGACLLTIADASNPSLTSTLAVQVNAGAPAISLVPKAVQFASASAAAQSAIFTGGAGPYTLSGCSGIANGTITNQTITVTPVAPGACSLIVSDTQDNEATLSVSVNAPATGSPLDNLTFHQNTFRNGWYQYETALTTTTVASSSFGPIATLTPPTGMPGFGKVYAQPLYVTNEKAVDGNQHNLVIIAGAADQVYAFDETTRAVVWHRDFTNAAAGIRQQLWSDTSCSDVNPDVGLISTPVIDRARDVMYVVVATMENGVPYTRIHAIGLGTGLDVIAPTAITGSVAMATGGVATLSSMHVMSRSALLEANGNIYVGLGSHCDFSAFDTHGWLIAYNASTLTETGNLVDLTNASDGSGTFLGSIWMAGFGPAADAGGNIYFATGNGPYDGINNFAMSIMKLPGNLNLSAATWFTPIQEAADSAIDHDVASGGVMLFPDESGAIPHLLIGGGKCSAEPPNTHVPCYKYILNRDAMGGQQPNNAGAVWNADTAGPMWGGPAYFVDSTGAQHVVYGTGAPLSTYTLNLAPIGLAVQSSANVGCLECRNNGGSQPIVSSNGTQAGTAIVWALKDPGNSGGSLTLYAFDALNMSHTLYAGNVGSWTQAPGTSWIGGAMISPLVANGRVYVPSDGAVTVLGLH